MARECGAVPDQMCCCGVDRFGRLRRSLDSPRASLLGFSGGGRLGTGDYCRLAGALPLVGPDRTTVGRSGRGVSGFEACSFIGPPPWWSTSREHRWVIFRERRRRTWQARSFGRAFKSRLSRFSRLPNPRGTLQRRRRILAEAPTYIYTDAWHIVWERPVKRRGRCFRPNCFTAECGSKLRLESQAVERSSGSARSDAAGL
jgi:hypothetical protein